MPQHIIIHSLSQRLTLRLKFDILVPMTIEHKKRIGVPAALDDKNLHRYVAEVGVLESLTAEEERELVLLKNDADTDIRREAAQKLILSNLWYVIYEAKKYGGYGVPLTDLIQEGNIGLMKAVKKFSPEYKVRVSTYARYAIKSEMNEFVIKNSKILKLATTYPQRKLFFKLQSNKKHLGLFTEQEAAEVAKKLNVKTSVVKEMEHRLGSTDLPYNSPLLTGGAGEDVTTPADYLESISLQPYDQLVEDDTNARVNDAIYRVMGSLSRRDRDIVRSRWMDDNDVKPTLHDLSAKYGVSAERIRQLEQNAIKKIGGYMRN